MLRGADYAELAAFAAVAEARSAWKSRAPR